MNEDKVIEKDKTKKIKKRSASKSERSSRRSGFNLLDALILVCLVATVALVVLVYSPAEIFNLRSNDVTIIYSINVSGVPADYAATINVSDIVTDEEGYNLGVVASDVEVEPHVIYEYRENSDGSGSIVEIVHPELVDLIITVSAKADINSDGYTVDGKRIALEAEYDIVLPEFVSKGICISLSEENANDAGASK